MSIGSVSRSFHVAETIDKAKSSFLWFTRFPSTREYDIQPCDVPRVSSILGFKSNNSSHIPSCCLDVLSKPAGSRPRIHPRGGQAASARNRTSAWHVKHPILEANHLTRLYSHIPRLLRRTLRHSWPLVFRHGVSTGIQTHDMLQCSASWSSLCL